MSITYIGANAGTGKTYHLTHDLAAKCENGYKPDNFIFTTFTVSATSDFKERARQVLCSKGRIEDANNINMAFIGTIDSFAQSLVCKYWYLKGLSPKLNIMTKEGRDNYITRSLENIMSNPNTMEAFERFRTYFSLKTDFWKEHLLKIIAGYSQYQYVKDGDTQYLANSRDKSKAFLQQFCDNTHFDIASGSDLDKEIRQIAQLLETLLTLDKADDDAISYIKRSYQIHDFKREVDTNCEIITYAKFLGLFASLPNLYTKAEVSLPNPKKSFGSLTAARPDDTVIKDLLDAVEDKLGCRLHPDEKNFLDTQKKNLGNGNPDWTAIFTHWVKTDAEGKTKIVVKTLAADIVEFNDKVKSGLYKSLETKKEVDAYINLIFETASKWDKDFRKFKADNHLLEYQDIESYAYQLLSEQEVIDDLRAQYKVIYVDEFQDCSPLQVKFFYKLSTIIDESVWVGDGKQSIYGFRGADIALNDRVAQYVQKKNPSATSLTTNYRSFPQLVYFANRLFYAKYGKKGISIPCAGKSDQQKEKIAADANFKSVHYLNYSENEKEFYNAIGARISELVEGGYQPKDIAVLCQTGTNCEKTVNALTRIGMKVNRGLKEIKDNPAAHLLSALLQLSVNNGDRLALAEIATLTCKNIDASSVITWKLTDNDHFLATIPLIRLFREKVTSFNFAVKPVSAIVKSLIYELDLNKIVHQWENGDANAMVLDFLDRLSVAYENNCKERLLPSTIEGFRQYMHQFCSKDEDDRDLQAGALVDGVVVTTCHRSKGLQWKVVFMPDLTFDSEHHPENKALEEGVEGVHVVEDKPLTNDEDDFNSCLKETWLRLVPFPIKHMRDEFSKVLTASGKPLEEELIARSVEEKVRLLYVTVTRPEEMLFIASQTKSSSEVSPVEWFDLLHIRVNGKEYKASDILNGKVNPSDKDKTDRLLTKMAKETTINIRGEETRNMDEYVSIENTCRENGLIKSDRTKLFVSPSGTYGTFVVEIKNKPTQKTTSRFTIGGDQAENGTLIHNIYCSLEKIASADREKTVEGMLQSSGLRNNFDKNAAKMIVEAWDNLDVELGKIAGTSKTYLHELPFVNFNANQQIVVGDIDLICKYGDNQVILVDYKTYPGAEKDVVDPTHAHYAGKYAGQFKCYKEALKANDLEVTHSFVYYPESQTLVELDLEKEIEKE